MNELTTFARLRPDDTLTEDDLAELRAELFGELGMDAHHDQGGKAMPPMVVTPSRRRRPLAVLVAAAVVAIVGVAALWTFDRRDHVTAPSPATEPGEVSLTPTDTGAYAVPLVGLAEPGWTVTSAHDNTFAKNRAVVLMSGDGLDGPWLDITATPADIATQPTVPVGDTIIDIGGIEARVTEIESGAVLRWTTGGRSIEALGWRMTADEVAAVVSGMTVDDSVIGVQLPPGASSADPDAILALGHLAEYSFTHTDGRELQISFTPGGSRGLYQREGPRSGWENEGRTATTIGEEPATVVDYREGGQYRVDILRGFWTWEFNATGFQSAQQLVDLVAGTTVVDTAQWNAGLSDRIVRPDDRAAQVDQVLTGVPVPPGFDRDALVDGGADDRYQFIVQVSAAVACGWFDEWFAGRDDGDGARMAAAAGALATSHEWAMLTEIAGEGGWSDVLWHAAGLVDGTVDPAAVSPVQVRAGLGCDQFG